MCMQAINRTKEYVKMIKIHLSAIEELLYLIQDDGVLPSPDAEADAVDLARKIRAAITDADILYKRIIGAM